MLRILVLERWVNVLLCLGSLSVLVPKLVGELTRIWAVGREKGAGGKGAGGAEAKARRYAGGMRECVGGVAKATSGNGALLVRLCYERRRGRARCTMTRRGVGAPQPTSLRARPAVSCPL
jgi:hypothetical protein